PATKPDGHAAQPGPDTAPSLAQTPSTARGQGGPAPAAPPGPGGENTTSTANPPPTGAGLADPSDSRSPLWPWLALALGLGWMGTAGAWWYRSRRANGRPSANAEPTPDPLAGALASLQRACTANDPKAAHAALLESQLAHAELLTEEIARLHAALYGRSPTPWQGAALWRATQAAMSQARSSQKRAEPDLLPPLYPS
ncbi:MAG: hypothetical protein HQL97_15865, partial [Magnetococcales bacterium]|nr:hypothetical protein [Magnetococcales bacterium]